MALSPISLGTRSNPGRNAAAGNARLINCYAEDAGEEGKIRFPLYAVDGFSSFATSAVSGTGAIRAMLSFSSTAAYIVSGNKVLKSDTNGTLTTISGKSATATISIASPAVVTLAGHGLAAGAAVQFSTTGALPTGITAGTTYYVRSTSLATNTFTISATAGTNGTAVNTSGTQSGTHTLTTTSTVSASGFVTIARNRADTPEIGIVTSDGNYYVIKSDVLYDYGGVIAALGSGTLQGLAFHDGYFVLGFDNGDFFTTGIDVATSVDPLKFAEAESSADGLVRPIKRGTDLLILGERSTEFWSNTGASDFPYDRSAVTDYGCYAFGSVANVVSLGEGTIDTIGLAVTNAEGAYSGIALLDGYSARKISTPAVDRAIQNGAVAANLRGYTRSEGGRVFYCITDQSTFTWVYCLNTGFWHEEQSSGLSFRRVVCAMNFGGYTILGDYALAKLYKVQNSLYSASASVLTLKHSNNNGSTWDATRTISIGTSSALTQRFKFHRLGQSKEDGKLFQITISNAVMEDGTGISMTVQPPAVHAFPNPMRFHTLFVDVIPGVSQNAGAKGITGLAVEAEALRG